MMTQACHFIWSSQLMDSTQWVSCQHCLLTAGGSCILKGVSVWSLHVLSLCVGVSFRYSSFHSPETCIGPLEIVKLWEWMVCDELDVYPTVPTPYMCCERLQQTPAILLWYNAAKVMDTNLNFFMFCVKRRDGKAFDPLLSIDTAW